jgi:hypothetical protein
MAISGGGFDLLDILMKQWSDFTQNVFGNNFGQNNIFDAIFGRRVTNEISKV